MASQTEIINNGLEEVGADTITSIDEGSKNANVASKIYAMHRQKLLRRHTWNFATKRIKLAQSATDPVYEFDHQYPIPSDFLRVVSVSDNEDGLGTVRYKMEYDTTAGRTILCSSEEVWLRYIADITDTQKFDPTFAYCLSLSMATVFAVKIANSNTLAAEKRKDLTLELRAARSVDGQEDYPERMPDGSWANSRHSGVSDSWG